MKRPSRLSDPALRHAAPLDDAVAPNVWLVDDSHVQREISRQILAQRHALVVFEGAAPMLERLSAGERPDVLVLDWHMPEISGLDACRYVRSLADGGELPVLVLTATGARQAEFDNVWVLRFGPDGRCSEFHEWFAGRPEHDPSRA